MTEEDLQPKDPKQMREDTIELIKEAKSKIRPVFMTQEDREKYIAPIEDFYKHHDDWNLIDIDKLGSSVLDF